ncbi:hypothetical protein AAVH_42156, partial [Aphelenchoides avenae]
MKFGLLLFVLVACLMASTSAQCGSGMHCPWPQHCKCRPDAGWLCECGYNRRG